MKEKVMITGASGFLGFHLIEAALNKGLEVHAAIRKNSNVTHLKNKPVTFTYLDLGNIESLQQNIEANQYHYIIHAAGTTKANSEQDYNTVNATYTFNLAKAADQSQKPIKKFVFISSLAAAGPLQNFDTNITENSQPGPVTSYGRSKLLAEEKLETLSIPSVILRPTAVYGPRDKDILVIFKSIKNGIEPYIGTRNQQLSFVYAKDVASITIDALFSGQTGVYNISDGNCYTRYALADCLKRLMKTKTIRFHLPKTLVKAIAISLETTSRFMNKMPLLNKEKINEIVAVNWVCNIDKARKELGYKPVYDLETGLKETLDWYKVNKWI
ncbi:MAG: NAD(P)-dependent oxidoreductase [Ginsengibacter sp.]